MLVLINYDEADAWYITGYNGYTGYVMKQYVALNESPITAWQYGRVTSNTLNVRKAPGTSSACWNHVWPKDRIALIKTIPDTPGWYETLYRGEAAYVSGQHIAMLGEEVPGVQVYGRQRLHLRRQRAVERPGSYLAVCLRPCAGGARLLLCPLCADVS